MGIGDDDRMQIIPPLKLSIDPSEIHGDLVWVTKNFHFDKIHVDNFQLRHSFGKKTPCGHAPQHHTGWAGGIGVYIYIYILDITSRIHIHIWRPPGRLNGGSGGADARPGIEYRLSIFARDVGGGIARRRKGI